MISWAWLTLYCKNIILSQVDDDDADADADDD